MHHLPSAVTSVDDPMFSIRGLSNTRPAPMTKMAIRTISWAYRRWIDAIQIVFPLEISLRAICPEPDIAIVMHCTKKCNAQYSSP